MSIFSPAIKQFLKMRIGLIDNFVLNPVSTQLQVFNKLIGSAQFTQFGKQYDFTHINNPTEFKERVPISDYDDLKPYIDQILAGEQNVLWSTPIHWFAKSSGTTSDKSKFIPVSQEALTETHYKSGKDLLAMYLHQHPDSAITSGKCLTIGGSHQINQLSADSYFGDLSAVMLQNMPLIGQLMQAPDLSVALMDEWEQKLCAIINSVQDENITYIAGVPTWTLVMIKQMMAERSVTDLHDIWPDLELYIHGGVSFAPYQKQFEALFQSRPINYLETYNASEGFFAGQDEVNANGMLLFLSHGIYYEFMPVLEHGKEKPETLAISEVELNTNYALVISTNAGLWRYLVGDTIQFTSLVPYRIKVTGRLKHFINAFGEEVIVDNSDNAIAAACAATGALVADYTAGPVYMSEGENGAHEWIIEFEQLPVSLSTFVQILDKKLQSINSDYEAKRYKDIALRLPIVHQMQGGGFNNWLKSKGKLGGQNKVPRLSNDRKFLNEILPFIKNPQ